MKDNTLKVDVGIEVYEHDIYAFTDRYIKEELNGDESKVKGRFPALLLYIHDRVPRPSNDDIELLDGLFDIFVRLCARYETLPSLEGFSFLTGISNSTFTDWRNGEYRKSSGHGRSVKRWKDICRAFLVDKLSNSSKPEVNLIFLGKANFGMRETSPVPAEEITSGPTLTREEIAARFEGFKELPDRLELDEIE